MMSNVATISITLPSKNVDESILSLAQIAHINVYADTKATPTQLLSTIPGPFNNVEQVFTVDCTQFGYTTVYFDASVTSVFGIESAPSGVASKTFSAPTPKPPVSFSVA